MQPRVFLAPLILLCLVWGGGALRAGRSPDGQILAVMDAQVAAWNRGDIEAFLDGYDKSPDLLFASRGTFSRGWEPLLERYREHYPDGKMGTLSFEDVEVHPLAPDAAWVVGEWRLEMADAAPHGVFTLIFRNTAAGWRIVHDHSSAVPTTSNSTEKQ